MFKSGILNIRKVWSESNIKLFEYFGQPTIKALMTIQYRKNEIIVKVIIWNSTNSDRILGSTGIVVSSSELDIELIYKVPFEFFTEFN